MRPRSVAPVQAYHLAAPGAWRLWCIFFAYSAVVALLVQLVVLPYILPAIHDGHGLLVEGDWVYHHGRSADLAQRVLTEGWSTWRLRPQGEHALHGVVSAVYAVTVAEPWTLIPLHAALHATSALVLMWVVAMLVPSGRHALLAALPFLLFPSAMIGYTQVAKDVYTICGGFLFLYGWLLLAECRTRWPGWRAALTVIALIVGGTTLSWSMRPYTVYILQGIATLFAVMLSARNVAAVRRESVAVVVRGLTASTSAWSVVLLLFTLFTGAGMYLEEAPAPNESSAVSPPRTMAETVREPVVSPDRESTQSEFEGAPALPDNTSRATLAESEFEGAPALPESDEPWTELELLPGVLRDALYSVSAIRLRWVSNEGNSTIDLSFMPESSTDMLRYLPRAMVVAFLSPFPYHWFQPGSIPSTTLMRRITGVEMLLVYVAWLSLAVVAWLWRSRIELWLILVYSLVNILVWTFAIPNLGTLYRVRYGPLMLLVGLGLAGGAAALSGRRLAGQSTSQSP